MSKRVRTSGSGRDRDGEFIRIPAGTLLARGLTRRCAVCGSGGLFRRWFHMVDHCPRCGFRSERREGQFVGAVGVNTIVTFGLLLVVLAVGFVLTAPDIAEIPLLIAALVVAVGVPVLFQPVSKTLWNAVDLIISPLEVGEAPGLEVEGDR